MHNIETRTYRDPADKKAIAAAVDNYVSIEGDTGGGLYNSIRWLDSVQPLRSRAAAEEFLEANDDGDYDSLAVRYYDTNERLHSARLDTLYERRRTIQEKILSFENTNHFASVKSSLITCKACGSKIAKEYAGNKCPVCHVDMRPKTALDRLQRMKDSKAEVEHAIDAENARLFDKAKKDVYWLLKFEYHS